MSYGRYLYEDMIGQLKAAGEEGILPTFVVLAKSLFFVYVLEKPFFLGKAKGKKKENALKDLEHIAEGVSDTLNSACDGIYAEPVKLNGYIPLPGKTYCIYEREYDKKINGFRWTVAGAVIGKLEVPEGARRYEADILADVCMQRMPESWWESRKKKYIMPDLIKKLTKHIWKDDMVAFRFSVPFFQ